MKLKNVLCLNKLQLVWFLLFATSLRCSQSNISNLLTSKPSVSKLKLFAASGNILGEGGSMEIDGYKLNHLIEMSKNLKDITLFVDFYNPRCPHCKNFAPIYESSALDSDSNSDKNMFFKIDVTKFNHLIKEFNINFLPDVRVTPFIVYTL